MPASQRTVGWRSRLIEQAASRDYGCAHLAFTSFLQFDCQELCSERFCLLAYRCPAQFWLVNTCGITCFVSDWVSYINVASYGPAAKLDGDAGLTSCQRPARQHPCSALRSNAVLSGWITGGLT